MRFGRERENRRRVSARALTSLATALRSGRAARRRILRDLASSHFLDVLPLWLGTLAEIDDTLPSEPGVFDVVIFDEASQIDQLMAAPALARARRAVIVGDPRQLRHVSFVSDAAMAEARASAGLTSSLASVADVRRNSLFDVGAGVSAVSQLTEHFRSAPHIIGFSNERFYQGRLRLLTQHPATETRDAIDVVRVRGSRDDGGVNAAEVVRARQLVAESMKADAGVTVGVLSPFRAQADALEEAMLAAFSHDEIGRSGLRVGTVHSFQGNERDVVVISLAIGRQDLGQSLRFVEDPNLFNVMITRARNQVHVIASLDPAALPRGLLRDYLRYADEAPLPSETNRAPTAWVGELSTRLEGFGLPVVADYPVAGHTVDLAVGAAAEAVGVECVVHPDGPAAHIERHRALRRAGWDLVDAFQSRWLALPDAAVETIVERVLTRRARASTT